MKQNKFERFVNKAIIILKRRITMMNINLGDLTLDNIYDWEDALKDILYDFDIESEKDIKTIIESGYKGLYGGLNIEGILKKKNISGRKFLDSVSGAEQVINLMRISQTIEAFKRQTVLSVKKAIDISMKIGKEIRNMLITVGSEMPENMEYFTKQKKTSINYDVLADLKERAARGELDLDE